MQEEVLTVAEVAKLLRVSRKTVEKLIYAKMAGRRLQVTIRWWQDDGIWRLSS